MLRWHWFMEVIANGQAGTSQEPNCRAFFTRCKLANPEHGTVQLYGLWRL